MTRAALISLFLAAPAGAATVPAFVIEAHDCGTVHTLHEDMTSAVVANDRGSRKYVCGYGVNPFAYDLMADLKGPGLFGNEYFLPVVPALLVVGTTAAPTERGMTASAFAQSWASAGAFSHTHTRDCTCGCGACELPIEPPEEPAPVSLPAGLPLLLSAMAGLCGLWRVRA